MTDREIILNEIIRYCCENEDSFIYFLRLRKYDTALIDCAIEFLALTEENQTRSPNEQKS